ncbi:precorrin-6y C5,15-methyltransferase (decarboxylating) subunit CbiE [Pseudomonas typographi]|uniref:Precorrin-6y C5,15-methyltransferase (Decarboxylating) subunit CbiE n=1 Tax=Pseudomonas typographi TaxID=2715964 RepID=A0ABR7Z7U2_9PSED|nr:precorrin-6y C5,15-methyltransferase (decarboxylating) subunit CbiE [Pseudomonas typographi]MBD1554328.1 precorrin-6y C5,15-methyltransferase (decarboxylating) subunit CbiE [Pseudomonas typographi]MBD1601529.1 precorrin-6y C5,15-methyltransferase (decarboxylating) subunit CbiE [Pseudomonas typographi]
MSAWLTIVGIGEDGYSGLGKLARRALLGALRVYGSDRQLALLPRCISGERLAWPSPFSLAPVLAARGEPVCVLASGDPMLHGVGASLARALPIGEMAILPAPSSCSLAAARLGWPLAECSIVSLVAKPLQRLSAELYSGQRLLLLSNDEHTPGQVAELLCERGFGASEMTVFEHLGGPAERRQHGQAQHWPAVPAARLNLVAVECRAVAGAMRLARLPGLPDAAFHHDGQITKRDVRAITLARLAPQPGELLWDVGAGAGSVGIEWMRSHPACRAIAIEANPMRQGYIVHNREVLGVPGLQLVTGHAPQALAGLPAPDAVFIGGGVTVPGMLETCWRLLKPGGRLVANAVTVQSEMALVAWRDRHGGELARLQLAHAHPLGSFDTWRQALPVTLLEQVKPGDA